ncbi:hypothetical protein DH09_17040 [Bacillaceae bacterium JMAK1]|nr:hypothetical protein DH09_17040 [Bacillaceae bacterium JMAK1]
MMNSSMLFGGTLNDWLASNSSFSPEERTSEEQMIIKTAEQFVEGYPLQHPEKTEQQDRSWIKTCFQAAGELGLQAVEVPEAYGGLGLGKRLSGVVAEQVGNGGGSFSVSFNIHVGVGTTPYMYYGTEWQKSMYLPKLASGEWIGAYALTEPEAGSDALNGKTKAVYDQAQNVYRITGEKQWITNAHVADVFIVFAQTSEGMTAFIVERTMEGVSIGPEEKKMGIKGSSTATLLLDQVVVTEKHVLGELGKGHKIALNTLNLARLKLAFNNIGAAKRALQLATTYATERVQFKTPIASFTLIQEKLAEVTTAIYAIESYAYQTASRLDEVLQSDGVGDHSSVLSLFIADCAMCKTIASEVLAFATDEAVQIHGGYGYMQEYEVERLYRDARINRIFEGTNEINRLAAAKAVLKREVKVSHAQDELGQWIVAAETLYTQMLEALTDKPEQREQEVLRWLADGYGAISMMRASYLRSTTKGSDQKNNTTRVVLEEGFQTVQNIMQNVYQAIEQLVPELELNVPTPSNVMKVKRRIAENVIERKRYTM